MGRATLLAATPARKREEEEEEKGRTGAGS